MEDYYSIHTTEHYPTMFSSLHTLQKQGVLCDVILAAEDGEVMAHKVLLMAASSYFRQRLSPVMSANASRIYLKGISVVELANLVKYIYTGKLIVAKETMDVTLEVSEILELNGIIQGYREIVEYEQTRGSGGVKTGGGDADQLGRQLIHGHDINMSMLHDTSVVEQKYTPVIETKGPVVNQAVPQNSDDIHVTQYCEDGSTITYSVENQEGTDMAAPPQTSQPDYNFEFNPFEQQYMDVSAGTSLQPAGTSKSHNTDDILIDENAQHQDLLSVAIMKLSDGSQSLTNDGTLNQESTNDALKKSPSKKPDEYLNGKLQTKIVTLSAGKINNDLGGQTSVYTVALDPSTINKPLKMPRFQRKKTDKERVAEQNAKRYRQKKAELIAVKGSSDSPSLTEDGCTDLTGPLIQQEREGVDPLQVHCTEEVSTQPVTQLVSSAPPHTVIPATQSVSAAPPHTVIHVPTSTKHNGGTNTPVKEENHQSENTNQSREDFGCSVDFDTAEEGKYYMPKIILPSKLYKQLSQRTAADVTYVAPLMERVKVPLKEPATEEPVHDSSPEEKAGDKTTHSEEIIHESLVVKKNVGKSSPLEKKNVDKSSPLEKKNSGKISPVVKKNSDKSSPSLKKNSGKSSPPLKKNGDKSSPLLKKSSDKSSPVIKKNVDKSSPLVKKGKDKSLTPMNKNIDKSSLLNKSSDNVSPLVKKSSDKRKLLKKNVDQSLSIEKRPLYTVHTPGSDSKDKIISIKVGGKRSTQSSQSKKTSGKVIKADNPEKVDEQTNSAKDEKQNNKVKETKNNNTDDNLIIFTNDEDKVVDKDKDKNKDKTDFTLPNCEASKCLPDTYNEKPDAAMSNTLRSSATKRKGKVPRRLSVTPCEKGELNRRNIPIVRTRRNSKNEGNRKRRNSKSKSPEETDHDDVVGIKDIVIETDVEVKEFTLEAEMDVCDDDATLDSNLTELEKEGYTEIDESEVVTKKTNEKIKYAEKSLVGKHMQPHVRLVNVLSPKGIESLSKDVKFQKQYESDDKSEGFLGEIDVDIQTYVTNCEADDGDDDDDDDEEENVELDKGPVKIEDKDTKQRGMKRRQSVQNDLIGKKVKAESASNECDDRSKLLDAKQKSPSRKHLNKGETATIGKPSIRSNKAISINETSLKKNGGEDRKSATITTEEAPPEDAEDNIQMIYACPEEDCGFTSPMKGNVQRHRIRFHGTAGSSEKPEVMMPEKGPQQGESNKQGESTKTKDDNHMCKCCTMTFRSKIALKGHLKCKLVFGNCKCMLCDTTFRKGSDFFNHLNQQHDIAAHKDLLHYDCKECDYVGFSSREINSHYLQTHEGKVKKCSRCQEVFDTAMELKAHAKVHKEKQVCSYCSFSTYNKASLSTHIRLKHQADKEENMCQFCAYKTPLVGNLRKHMRSAHELTVVTKQSTYNRDLYKDFDEGTLLTKEGHVFDPETTPLPKVSHRKHGREEEEEDIEAGSQDSNDDGDGGKSKRLRGRRGKVPLMTLSSDDFTKEIMKRHVEYLQKPEKVHRVMSKSLAVATAHPSFPQASPSVRVNKANKLYNTPKPNHLYTELDGPQAVQYLNIEAVDASLPSVEQEVVIPDVHDGGAQSDNMMVTLPVGVEGKMLQVVINQDGQNSLVGTMDMVNALLEAGHQIQVQDEVEIQNE